MGPTDGRFLSSAPSLQSNGHIVKASGHQSKNDSNPIANSFELPIGPPAEQAGDGPSLRPSASLMVADEDFENDEENSDDFGPPSFVPTMSMQVLGDNEGAPLQPAPSTAGSDDGDHPPSFVSVNRGGNRRSQPATKAQLQAAFEAALNAQNFNNDSTSREAVNSENNEDGAPTIDQSSSSATSEGDSSGAPEFAGVARGGTFRMESTRDVARSARQVPDTFKNFEFDGFISGHGEGNDTRDALIRATSVMDTLKSGTKREKEGALYELQKILPEIVDGDFDISSIVGDLCSYILDWSRNLQVLAADTLQHILKHAVSPVSAHRICDVAFRVLKGRIDTMYYEIWGDVLVRAVPLVTWRAEEVVRYFAVLDVKKDNQRMVAKRLIARSIGFFASGLDKVSVETLVLPRALALATEADVNIRGMIAESLANIGGALHVAVVQHRMWPSVRKLVKDPDHRVRATAVRSVADLAMKQRQSAPGAPLFTKLLPNMFLRSCAEARDVAGRDLRFVIDSQYLNLEIKALTFGKLLVCTYDHLKGSDERRETLKAYVAMSTCNAPVVRRYCAYNLPGVASVFTSRYRMEVSVVVGYLANDKDAETRWKLGAGLHETVKLLASRDTASTLYEAVCKLMNDSNALVRLNVMKHFHETVSTLAKQRGYSSASRLTPLFSKLHLQCQGNWRTQELLATQLRQTAALVPPPTIAANVLPVLYALASQSAWRVRKEGMYAVAACLRHLSDTSGRELAMAELEKNWARSPMYWMRMGFLDAAEVAARTYSRLLFRDTFAIATLRLAADPVSNVRLRVARILLSFAPAVHMMEEFNVAVHALSVDRDVDICEVMRNFKARLEVVLETSQANAEHDLDLEEEEQNMHARHLQLQRDKRKKQFHQKAPGIVQRSQTSLKKNVTQNIGRFSISPVNVSNVVKVENTEPEAVTTEGNRLQGLDKDIQLNPTEGDHNLLDNALSPKVDSNQELLPSPVSIVRDPPTRSSPTGSRDTSPKRKNMLNALKLKGPKGRSKSFTLGRKLPESQT